MLKRFVICCACALLALCLFARENASAAKFDFESDGSAGSFYTADSKHAVADRMEYNTATKKWTFRGRDLKKPVTHAASRVRVRAYDDLSFADNALVVKDTLRMTANGKGFTLLKEPGKRGNLAIVKDLRTDKEFLVPQTMHWRSDRREWEFVTQDDSGATQTLRYKDEEVAILLSSMLGQEDYMHAADGKVCLGYYYGKLSLGYSMCVSKPSRNKWLITKD